MWCQASEVMFRGGSKAGGSGSVRLSAADVEAIIAQGGVPRVALPLQHVVGSPLVDISVAAKLMASKGACERGGGT